MEVGSTFKMSFVYPFEHINPLRSHLYHLMGDLL